MEGKGKMKLKLIKIKSVIAIILAIIAAVLWSKIFFSSEDKLLVEKEIKTNKELSDQNIIKDLSIEEELQKWRDIQSVNPSRESPFVANESNQAEFSYTGQDYAQERKSVEDLALMQIKLLGIIKNKYHSVAILQQGTDTYFLKEGLIWNDFRIKEINQDGVILSKDMVEYNLELSNNNI